MAHAHSNQVVVRLLGDFQIGFDDDVNICWRSKKCTNLLALLLIDHDRLVSRERLERALWPRPEQPAGPTALKVVVHTLRRALDTAFGPDRDFLHIESGEGAYQLRLGERVRVDIHEFERLCRQGSEAEWHGSVQTAVDNYGRAAEIYRGDFLARRGEEWVCEHREWLRAKMMHALTALVQHASDIDDAPAAVRHARRMLELDPTAERAFQAMILIHGRRAELEQAKYWYELCAARLERELDTAPQEETRRLLLRAHNGDLISSTDARRIHSRGCSGAHWTVERETSSPAAR
ncbi:MULTISPECIES: AfsR/SARP family transcriptional regulator [Nocardia]|jgi:DNA-binding SARP family transcriptional activator|uniref:OmpR/PhoB-type domain-containing protein n=2 Tax=Nocardia TaxID=1817 RepID=A0A2T2YT16_9NOCA|nr:MULTISPECIES: BTAD domain-containing putative transcriptional regulator [Nocardia]PSR58664.1 hypothetical protein C8259_29405 [Nocardia nova]